MTASRWACLLLLCLLSSVGAGCDPSPRPRPWPVHWAHPALAAVVADYVRALPVDPFTQVVRVTRTTACAPAAVVQVEASIHHPYSAFARGTRPVGYAVQDGTLLVFYDERPGAPPVDVEAALTALLQQRHLRLQRGLERLYCPPIWFLVTWRSPPVRLPTRGVWASSMPGVCPVIVTLLQLNCRVHLRTLLLNTW